MTAFQIMAHPRRKHLVGSLRETLDAGVTWDERQDRWDTGRRAWEALQDSGEEYGCVIQDDAVLCRGFAGHLERALPHVPERSPVVLYAGTSLRGQFRNIKGASWVVMRGIIWGPGIVMPTALIPDVLAFGDRYRIANYDLRLSKWFERHGIPVFYTWPSLVDHRNGPSLVPGRNGGRHAYYFQRDPNPDWALPPVVLARLKPSR